MNYTYILQCADDTYYTGWTNDIFKRLKAHNESHGAKYTRTRCPVSLIYYEEFQTKQEAMRREWEIKQLTRKEKEKLIQRQTERWGTMEERLKNLMKSCGNDY